MLLRSKPSRQNKAAKRKTREDGCDMKRIKNSKVKMRKIINDRSLETGVGVGGRRGGG